MYAEYLAWQERRLASLGVDVTLGKRATGADVRAERADIVAVATGAGPRTPDIEGVDADHVLDIRDVLAGRAIPGHRVAVIAQDDHVAPLSVADKLATAGHAVTVFYATAQPAPLLGRYILGGILGRLDENDVAFNFNEEVVSIGSHALQARNVYSWKTRTHSEFDSFVLACGSASHDGLYNELVGELPEVHILGDAYAPRRLVFATRQAHALAQQLVTD
jgi:pyruvate/2-oxoglutarate dehydrogenase complex dihydrolipoamide dehydrogenase (E3) component